MTPNGSESGRGIGLASILETVRRRFTLALLPFLFLLVAVNFVAKRITGNGLWS